MKKMVAMSVMLVLVIAEQMLFLLPTKVFAADFSVAFPKTAQQGTVVAFKINIEENSGLTTLGLRLCYNSEILTYKGMQWSETFANGSNRQGLVSDVEHLAGRAVNISLIDTAGYKENGTLITVYFEVQQDYFESPVSLEFRDATDGAEKIIHGNTHLVFLKQSGLYLDRNGILLILWGIFVVSGGIALTCIIVKSRLKSYVTRERREIIGY